jgi:hypothetical protein
MIDGFWKFMRFIFGSVTNKHPFMFGSVTFYFDFIFGFITLSVIFVLQNRKNVSKESIGMVKGLE